MSINNKDMVHGNHDGVSVAVVLDELRITNSRVPTPSGQADGRILKVVSNALAYGDEAAVAADLKVITSPHTLAAADDGAVLYIETAGSLTLNLPDSLGDGFQFALVGEIDGSVTLNAQGASSVFPSGFTPLSGSGVLTVLSCALQGTRWSVAGAEPPDTVTVVYDAGWPADRPNASHVLAVGHTTAPSWLTSADTWLEAV